MEAWKEGILFVKRLGEEPCYDGKVLALIVCGEKDGVFVA